MNTRCPCGVPVDLLGVIFGLIDDVYLVGGTEKQLMMHSLLKRRYGRRDWNLTHLLGADEAIPHDLERTKGISLGRLIGTYGCNAGQETQTECPNSLRDHGGTLHRMGDQRNGRLSLRKVEYPKAQEIG
jgi:hypothetical protein